LSERFHLLRLVQLFFQHSARGDVLGNDLDGVAFASRTRTPVATGSYSNGFAVLAPPGEFHAAEEVCACGLSTEACIPLGIQITRDAERKNLRLGLVPEQFHQRGIRMEKPVLLDTDSPDPVRSMFDKRAQLRFGSAHRLFRAPAFCQVNSDGRKIGFAFEFHPHPIKIVGDGAAILAQHVHFYVARSFGRKIGFAFEFHPHPIKIVGDGAAILAQHVHFHVARSLLQDFIFEPLRGLSMFISYIAHCRNRPGPIAKQPFGVFVPAQILPGLVLQYEESRQVLDNRIRQSLLS